MYRSLCIYLGIFRYSKKLGNPSFSKIHLIIVIIAIQIRSLVNLKLSQKTKKNMGIQLTFQTHCNIEHLMCIYYYYFYDKSVKLVLLLCL
jgi:uncharacterized membrane protein